MDDQTSLCVVLLSGGVESATLIPYLRDQGWEVALALSYDYGQKHKREILAATAIAEYFDVEHRILSLPRLPSPVLTREDQLAPDAKAGLAAYTYVYGRNAILLSYAVAYAQEIGATAVFYGASGSDYEYYPDCRPAFIFPFSDAMLSGYGVAVGAPFVDLNKAEVVRQGLELGVPYHLCYTCYRGAEEPCLQCDACVTRLKAMEANGCDYYGHRLR